MKSQIALIGTEGSGKTVLTTVLAKKLATMQDGGIWLDPQGSKTAKYVAENWNTLCGGEWLPSTPAGILFDLHWKMRTKNGECPMRIIDSAGQDLRRLFRDEEFKDPDLTDQDRQFIKYIADSTILLVLVNLRDFLGEPDKNKVIENSLTLKSVLGELQKDGKKRKIAFVFTACDLYEMTIQREYGTVEKFIERELPYLHNAYVADKPVKCFSVAAVADTEVKRDNQGKSWRVPAPNFKSNGFEPLMQWLGKTVAAEIIWAKVKKGILLAIAIIIVLFVANKVLTRAERLKTPHPELFNESSWRYDCFPGVLDCWSHKARADVPIHNNGGAGDITVTFSLDEHAGSTTEYFNQDEKKWVRVNIKKLPHHDFENGSIDFRVAGE